MADFDLRSIAISCALALTSVGCADAERIEPPPATGTDVQHTVTFVGSVFDGAAGMRLSDYTIDVAAGAEVIGGTLGADGRFTVGPISAWDDYTVTIGNAAYRTFVSHNANVGLPPELAQSDDIADISTSQTLYFDAFLFPSDLEAPAVAFTIQTGLPGEMVDGKLRLLPISPSVLSDSPIETPAGVPGQVWSNDEDLQGQTVTRDFAGGQLALNAGELIYGVTYQVDIFDVPGFQPLTSNYTAGIETNKSFTITEEIAEPLVVLSSTIASCAAPSSPNATSAAVVTIEFNHPVEFQDTGFPGGALEAFDEGISVNSDNTNMDMVFNTLQPDDSNSVQERGITVALMGNTMNISWNPSVGLLEKDPGDTIVSVTYGGLGNVSLRRVSSPSSATTLATLIGQGSIVCN